MSFLKITDPNKREHIVAEFLKTKRNIKKNYLDDRIGKIDVQRDMSEIFQPVIKTQENIIKELKPIKSGIRKIPKTLPIPYVPAIAEPEPEEEEAVASNILGPIATKYLQKYVEKEDGDNVFGFYNKDNKFYIGNKETTFQGDDIVIDNKEYKGTSGLWELIVSKNPKDFTPEDYNNYAQIMVDTNSLWQDHDRSKKPKASRSSKWKNVMAPIWEAYKKAQTGSGTTVIPSDSNALCERLDLLMKSQAAGNTGVQNELVSICDELKRQGAINNLQYKNINNTINKQCR